MKYKILTITIACLLSLSACGGADEEDAKPKPLAAPPPAPALTLSPDDDYGFFYAKNAPEFYTREQAHWAYVAADEFLLERKAMR